MCNFHSNNIFINNKYTKIYFKIISKYQTQSGERHHIIPKSLGGDDSKNNIVTIPLKVHFLVHKLLCKMVANNNHKRSMYFALFQMMNRKICKFTSRDYELTRLKVKYEMSLSNPMYNSLIRAKFRRKRPEQSNVATKRNNEYWATRARPIRVFQCPICSTLITTRVPTKTTCSRSCSTKFQHMNK